MFHEYSSRLNYSIACQVISVIFFCLELISIYENPTEHYIDLYNVCDTLQIFFQTAYTLMVFLFKDLKLPWLYNNPSDHSDYDLKKVDDKILL